MQTEEEKIRLVCVRVGLDGMNSETISLVGGVRVVLEGNRCESKTTTGF